MRTFIILGVHQPKNVVRKTIAVLMISLCFWEFGPQSKGSSITCWTWFPIAGRCYVQTTNLLVHSVCDSFIFVFFLKRGMD